MRRSAHIAAAGLALVLCGSANAPAVARADLARTQKWPQLRGHVNDYAGILPAERAAALERRLAGYEQQTGQQFVLLTLASLEGEPIEEYTVRVFEHWKLGRKGKDDGLLLVVVPGERKMRIEVGYGLEGVIPDAIAARAIREVLAPAFRHNDYAGGIDAAFGALMHVASGGAAGAEPVDAAPRTERRHRGPLLGPLLFPLIMFVLFALLGGRDRRRRGFFMMGPGFGGGFGGGGFGGGGFGGGGGRSGGGGASGSW